MLKLTYEVHFTTPFHIGSGYGFAGYLDSVVVRDSQGQVYLPGSTIKGKTRASAHRLATPLGLTICQPERLCTLSSGTPCPICAMFGSPQFSGTLHFDNLQIPEEYRSLLAFMSENDPFLAQQSLTGRRTNVMLSRHRRAARPDHLFTTEVVQTDLVFAGIITGEATQVSNGASGRVPPSLALLWSALEMINQIGRARSRGLGRCSVTVKSVVLEDALTRKDFEEALKVLQGGIT